MWQRRAAHPPTDAIHSDINALVSGDFDGDGREELAAAVGAWRAYDVRIFEAGSDGTLRVAARRRFGHVNKMAALRAVDGATLLAFAKDDTALSKEAWAPDEPQGEPAGIHIVRRRGDALVPVAYFSWTQDERWRNPTRADALLIGDVDADGLQDLVVTLSTESPFASLLLLLQRPDGSFANMTLGGFYPQMLGDFDGDPADELAVTIRRGDSAELCILGVDGEPVAVAPRQTPISEPPALTDPLLARAWARTDNLAGFGLHGDAARALERRIPLSEHEQDRHALQRRTAELFEAAKEYVRAGEHFEALAAEGDVTAALRAVADYEQDMRMADAQRVVRAALQRGEGTAEQADELRRAETRLAAFENRNAHVEQRFDGPLDPAWRIHEPLALGVDPVRGELVVDATADMRAIASLPIELTGEPLTLDFELEVDRAEWGTQFGVSIQTAGGEPVTELLVTAGGGGGYLRRQDEFWFWVFGQWDTPNPAERSTHRMRALVLPAHGRVHVEETGSHPEERHFGLAWPIRPGPHTLVLRSTGIAEFGSQQIRARIRRISLLGAQLSPPAGELVGLPARVAHDLVAGRWHEALGGDDDGSAEVRLWRGAALAELGRSAEASAAFASLDVAAPALRRQLRHLLRTRHRQVAPVLRAALGPAYAALLLESLQKKIEHADEELLALRLSATADLEGLPDAGDAAAHTTRAELLAIRGGVWKSVGQLVRAEVDLASAAALLERTAIGPDGRDPSLATIELRRAEFAATRGRVDEALAAAGRALRRATDPEWMARRLRISPALEPLRDDPRWPALFEAQ